MHGQPCWVCDEFVRQAQQLPKQSAEQVILARWEGVPAQCLAWLSGALAAEEAPAAAYPHSLA